MDSLVTLPGSSSDCDTISLPGWTDQQRHGLFSQSGSDSNLNWDLCKNQFSLKRQSATAVHSMKICASPTLAECRCRTVSKISNRVDDGKDADLGRCMAWISQYARVFSVTEADFASAWLGRNSGITNSRNDRRCTLALSVCWESEKSCFPLNLAWQLGLKLNITLPVYLGKRRESNPSWNAST